MKNFIVVLAFFGMLILYSCAENIYSDSVKGTNYNQYKTYALIPDADTSHKDGRINNDEVNYSIKQDVSDEMALRGFKLDTIHPDLLVLVHTFLKQMKDTVRTPLYSSYPYYYPGVYIGPWYPFYYPLYYTIPNVIGYNIHPVTYDEGSIAIDVIERTTNKIVWRGWAEENEFDPDKLTNEIRHKVSQIFNKFPVKVKYN